VTGVCVVDINVRNALQMQQGCFENRSLPISAISTSLKQQASFASQLARHLLGLLIL